MDEKQTILASLRAEFARWQGLLASLSEAQITAAQLPERWSIKDVVAHLHAWQQRSIARLEAALHGSEPNYPPWPAEFDPEQEEQPHELNAWLYEQSRDLPWPSVYQSWHAGFARLLELGQAIPAADLLEVDRYPWIAGYALIAVLRGTYEHHSEHAEYLEPVLAQIRQL